MTQPSRQSAFTLIELLVTISIIGVLIGLTFAGYKLMLKSGEKQATTTMLAQLAAAFTEYQVQTGGSKPSINGDINTFVKAIMERGTGNTAELILASVEEQFWSDTYYVNTNAADIGKDVNGNDLYLKDAWRNEIEYFDVDGDNNGTGVATGTPPRANPHIINQPQRPKPYFGSPGPDGLWGSFTNGDITQPDIDAKDNLYSFQIGGKS